MGGFPSKSCVILYQFSCLRMHQPHQLRLPEVGEAEVGWRCKEGKKGQVGVTGEVGFRACPDTNQYL